MVHINLNSSPCHIDGQVNPDKPRDRQTDKHPDKYATSLLLITLWPQRASVRLPTSPLPSFGCDMNNHTMNTPCSVMQHSLPLKRLWVIKIKTAKSLGNNFECQSGRKRNETDGRRWSEAGCVSSLCYLVWLLGERRENMDGQCRMET